jgi:hypothetical protein
VLELALRREVEVEDHLLTAVRVQRQELALHVLGQLQGERTLGHLVQ